jgi:galactokinase
MHQENTTEGSVTCRADFTDASPGRQLAVPGRREELSADKIDLLAQATRSLAHLEVAQKCQSAAFLVPGRVEFLGKHTDYCGGRSLLCTLDRGFAVVASPRTDRTIRIVESGGGPPITFELDPDLTVTEGHWRNYAMTVARRVARNFPGTLSGADIAFVSDLPQSSGLSSSSAMIIAFFLALAKINRLNERQEYQSNIASPEDLAGYLGTIENGQTFGTLTGDRGVGTFGGSQDHTAILCSKPGFLRQYAFCPVRHERDVPLPAGYVLAIAASGVIAEKTGAARDSYNALSLAVQTIVERWRQHSGANDTTLAAIVARGEPTLTQLRRLLSEIRDGAFSASRLIDRLEQFVMESNQIIPAAADALAEGRLKDLGQLGDTSQDLSERLLRNQVAETSFLAKSARDCGAVAASAFGAGFGGSVWALVRSAEAERFLAAWRKAYLRQFPERTSSSTFFVTAGGQSAQQITIDNG